MLITNAGSKRSAEFWTDHLENDEKNERAELHDIRGLAAETLRDALLEMREDSKHAPRCRNFMYHAAFNPSVNEPLTEQQWERAFEIFEKHRGIPPGQPRVVVEHEKHGRIHRHVIWQRVDLETLRAFPDGHDWRAAHDAAREIRQEFDLEPIIGPLDREKGTPRPPRAPKDWEMYRGMKTGIDPRDINAEVTELFHQSDNGKAFQSALEEHGYILVRGDRRGFVILDGAGKEHSLAKRLDGINTKELNAFMRDVEREALPSVEQGRVFFQERKQSQLQNELSVVQEDIRTEHLADIDRFLAAALHQRVKEDPSNFAAQWQSSLVPGVASELESLIRREELEEKIHREWQVHDTDELIAAALFDRWKKYPNHFQAHWQSRLVPGVAAELEKLISADADREHANRDTGRADSAWQNAIAKAAIEKERKEREFAEPKPTTETRAGSRNEELSPCPSSPEPEHPESIAISAWLHFANAVREAKGPAPEPKVPQNLRGASANIWAAWHSSDNAHAFVQTLEDKAIVLAAVTKDEARRSVMNSAFAREVGNFSPRYREGEIVAITEHGNVYQLNRRTTGENRETVEKFLKPIDRTSLQGIEATKQTLPERAEKRDALRAPQHDLERQAFRDLRGVGLLSRDTDTRPTVRPVPSRNNSVSPPIIIFNAATKVPGAALDVLAKPLDLFAKTFEGIVAPTLTPEQQAQGDIAKQRREAEGEDAIDFRKYTAETAQLRQQHDNDRQAELRKQRDIERDR